MSALGSFTLFLLYLGTAQYDPRDTRSVAMKSIHGSVVDDYSPDVSVIFAPTPRSVASSYTFYSMVGGPWGRVTLFSQPSR